MTIILDLDVETGLSRSYAKAAGMAEKETRHESRGTEFHSRLRQGFLEIAKQEPDRCVVLNADRSIEDLHNEIVKIVSERFGII